MPLRIRFPPPRAPSQMKVILVDSELNELSHEIYYLPYLKDIHFAVKTGEEGYTSQVVVGTSVTQLSGIAEPPVRSVIIKADDDNTGNIYVGFSDKVDAKTGFRLTPGQRIEIAIDDPAKIYLIADTSDQLVHVIVIK